MQFLLAVDDGSVATEHLGLVECGVSAFETLVEITINAAGDAQTDRHCVEVAPLRCERKILAYAFRRDANSRGARS